MIQYLISIFEKIKKKSILFKILCCIIALLYISIILICVIPIRVDRTTPGSVTNVSYVLSVDSENEKGNIYTVSVYGDDKVSVLEYWLSLLDHNSEIKKGKSNTRLVFTKKEEDSRNVLYKEQSIQDAIILAYETAKKRGCDVELPYSYKGYCFLSIPQNKLKTGIEDFRIGDIVTSIDDVPLESSQQFISKIQTLDENLPITNQFKVIRDGSERLITPSSKMIQFLKTLTITTDTGQYLINDLGYDVYDIDYKNAKPKINREKTYSVGPSGGFMQALSVYNAITPTDITHGKRIMGTGTIALDGNVGIIGAVEQKVITTKIYQGDLFMVPVQNYEDAKKIYDSIKKPSFSLVKIENFEEAIDYLEGLGDS